MLAAVIFAPAFANNLANLPPTFPTPLIATCIFFKSSLLLTNYFYLN